MFLQQKLDNPEGDRTFSKIYFNSRTLTTPLHLRNNIKRTISQQPLFLKANINDKLYTFFNLQS